jgi:hypothetical protein
MMALIVSVSAVACSPPGEAPAAAQQSATVVDSAIPRDVALTRFRLCCPPVDSLTGAAPTRDALVRGFVRALETKDTAALRAMVLTQGEFAWLYYDTSPQSLPPYNLAPALMWFLLEGNGSKGLARALDEYGGKPLGYVGYTCHEQTSTEGENLVTGPCNVRRVEPDGDSVQVRLFGLLLERGGRWKFVNYGNKL